MADSFNPMFEMPPLYSREELRPTREDWLRHGFLFLLTFFTATLAGILYPFGALDALSAIPLPSNVLEWILIVPFCYAHVLGIVFQQVWLHPQLLVNGLLFSISLLAILTAHEGGHYVACRIYGVKATLPYFIPLPVLSPAGTLGAVIKMQSHLPTTRAVFDIGVAGPLAGFVVILPIAFLGLWTMETVPPGSGGEVLITFADPLLTRLLGALIGVDPTQGVINPFYAASWVGLLVTALNLIPAGQLDGGHATYSVFGERAHGLIGRIAFVGMVILTILGWQLYGSPSGLLFVILLGVLLRIPHPPPLYEDGLDGKRRFVAFLTLLVFILSFMPFPIRLH